MLTAQTIKNDTLWVARMTYGARFVGSYDDMKRYADDEECKDIDLCANQPEHLKEFYDAYFKYEREHGFTLVNDFYKNVWAK